MAAVTNNMDARVEDRGLLIRSGRARGIREETTIRISRAREFIKEERAVVTRVERDLARWREIRAVEMVVADTDYLCVSYH
jgi:hypothetical protein